MATVPGVPDNTIPKTFAPTQADMLMAAAIMHQQGKFAAADEKPAPSPKIFDPKGRPGWPPLKPLDLKLYSPTTSDKDKG